MFIKDNVPSTLGEPTKIHNSGAHTLSGQSAPKQKPSKVLTVLAEGMSLVGNVASMGDMHVDGEVNGDIHSYRLTIGAKGIVNGSLFADEIIVSGLVRGEITGRVVTLMSSADVTGNVIHDSLSIEAGAHIQGLFKRGKIPPFSVNANVIIGDVNKVV